MEHYISYRKTLKRIYVVVDARHGKLRGRTNEYRLTKKYVGLKVADKEFLAMLDR